MKADEVPEGWSRLWSVVKIMMSKETLTQQHGKPVLCPSGLYTHLYRLTDSTMHLNPPGEVIMVDTPIELKTHLGFVMEAYGNVLVTGLASQNRQQFDCAWHDLWTDRSEGQPHLDIWHGQLLVNCRKTVKHQGAWALDRSAKSLLIRRGFSWIG